MKKRGGGGGGVTVVVVVRHYLIQIDAHKIALNQIEHKRLAPK